MSTPTPLPAGQSLYESVLGQDWERLPQPLRVLHGVRQRGVFEGEAQVEVGSRFIARGLRRLIGFPKAADCVPVRVTIEREGGVERWTRAFGRQRLRSELSTPADGARGVVMERFGSLRFRLGLPVDHSGLSMPVLQGRWCGLTLPRRLTPTSVTRETVDALGRFHFDVDVGLPGIGRIVRYRGWLVPVATSD